MADDTLQIVIRSSGGDQVVSTFKQVATGAQQMGVATEQSAQKSSRAFDALKRSQADLALGAAALGGAFTLASRAAADQTREIDAINRLYGESADQIIELSEAIQDNTNFSNDAARQAAITGSTLAQNYELSAEQIGILIERSADLAQVHGIDLADAMSRVAGAIRGEGEAAELLGLNMSDAAVASAAAAAGLEGWNTTMTEAEKAAFRYTLVLEQTTATQGAAADAANTTAGTIRHLTNEVQDVAVGFVQWTGPIGEATAALSDHALEITVVGGGLVKLAQGLQKAGVASAALNLAMGPAGLVAAAGLAGVAVYKVVKAMDDANLSAKEAKGQVSAFEETLAELGKGGMSSDTLTDLASFRDIIIELANDSDNASKRWQQAQDAALRASQAEQEAQAGGDLAALDAAHAKTEAAEEYVKTLEETIIVEDQLKDLREDLVSIFTDMNPLNADLVIGRLEELKYQFDNNIISADDFIAAISELEENADSYGLTIEEITSGQRRAVGATQAHTLSIEEQKAALERIDGVIDHNAQRWQEYDEAVKAARQADIDKDKASKELLASMSVQANEEAAWLDRNQQKWTEYDEAVRKYYDSREQDTRAAQAYLDELAAQEALAEAGAGAMDTFADASAGVGDAQTDVSAAIASANGAIEAQAASIAGWEGPVRTGIRAMQAFKDIQDGIIAQQDVFSQQQSEYGQQISAIEGAVDELNRRKEEGIAISAEEQAFLDTYTGDLERLNEAKADAVIQEGLLAQKYGENVSAGDRLNETMSGVGGAVAGLDRTIQTLIATMLVLNDTDAQPSVAIAGLHEALSGTEGLAGSLDDLDMTAVSASVTVAGLGAAISATSTLIGNLFTIDATTATATVGGGAGGMHGGAFARGGMVTIVAGEAGYERMDFANGGTAYAMTHGAYTVPTGTFITPHPESAASRGGSAVSIQINFTGGVTTGNLDAFLAEAERAVRARFASFGVE